MSLYTPKLTGLTLFPENFDSAAIFVSGGQLAQLTSFQFLGGRDAKTFERCFLHSCESILSLC